MAAGLGELILRVGANIAEFTTAMDKTQYQLGQLNKSVGELGGHLKGELIGAITEVAVAFAGLEGIKAFGEMITDTIEAQDQLLQLAQSVGTTGEKLSALIPAAKLADTNIESVAAVSEKFSKNLVQLADGTSKGQQAFEKLGFTAKDAARFLQDPVEGLYEVSKALNKFADDGNKTAAVSVVIGKAAAGMLPFFHDLGEQTELLARSTNDEIEAAHRLSDQWKEVQLRGDELKLLFVNALVPTLSKLLEQFTEATSGAGGFKDQVKELAADGTFAIWLLEAAKGIAILAETFISVGKAIYAFSGSVQVVINDMKVLAALASGGLSALNDGGFEALLEKRGKDLADANERWAHLWDDNKTIVSDRLTAEIEDLNKFRDAYKKTLDAQAKAVADFNTNMDQNDRLRARQVAASARGDGSGRPSVGQFSIGGAEKVDEFTRAMDALNKQAALASASVEEVFSGVKLTEADKFLIELQNNTKAWKSLTDSQKAAIEAKVQTVAAQEREAEAMRASSQAVAAYIKALGDLASTVEAVNARTQAQGIQNQLADNRRAYEQGLVDFQTFYTTENALQKQLLDTQTNQLDADISAQKKVIEGLQQAYVDFTTSVKQQQLPLEAQLTGAQQAAVPLLNAMGKLTQLEGQRNVVQQQGAQIGKDYIDQLVRESNGLLTTGKALADQIQARQRENEEIGLTASQIADLHVQRLIEERDVKALAGATPDVIAFYDAQIEGARKLADLARNGEGTQRVLDGFRDLESGARNVFADIFENGDQAFKNLGQSLKKWLIDLLYQLTLKPFLIQIAAQVTGVGGNALANVTNPGGFTNLLLQGGSGGGGGLSSLLSGLFGGGGGGSGFSLPGVDAYSLEGGAGTLVGGGAGGLNLGSLLGTGAGFLGLPTVGAGLANLGIVASSIGSEAGFAGGLAAIGGATTALASLAAVALPVVGIFAALAASGSLFKSEPSEVRGQFGIQQGTTGFEDNAFTASPFGNLGFLDQGTQYFSGEAAQVFNQAVGDLLKQFAGHETAAQQQETTTRLQSTAFPELSGTYTTEDFIKKYGDQVLRQVAQTAFDVLDPQLAKALTGFQGVGDALGKFVGSLLAFHDLATKLPADVYSKLVSGLDGTQETLDKITEFAVAFEAAQDLFNADPMEDAGKVFQNVNQTAATALETLGNNLLDLNSKYDGTAQATTALVTATQQYYAAEVQLLAGLEQAKVAISSLFEDTIRNIQLSVLDNRGKGNFLNQEIADLQNQLFASSDPQQIQQLANQINQDINQLFGLLTPEEQQRQADTFVDRIRQLNTEVQQRINDVEGAVTDTGNDILTSIKTSLDDAVDKFGAAVTQQQTSVDQFSNAVDNIPNPIQVVVTPQTTAAETNG